MNSFSTYCQGESHIIVDKVCQDYALDVTRKGTSIAIVCDGHGGERYFRSDVGAKYAADVALKQIQTLLKNSEEFSDLLEQSSFTQVEAITTQRSKGNLDKETNIDKMFRQLFKSIIAGWRNAIFEHARTNPLTDIELSTVPEKYTKIFQDCIINIDSYTQSDIEKTYGCTLIVAVITRKFWFAFHIGDGKCISFSPDGNWMEPIPWDDNCFLNKTTSLCDSEAIDEFRYCYGNKESKPIAIFLGSDGIDDSFGEVENMVNFYVQIAKLIATGRNGGDLAYNTLKEDLPQLSKIGSKDDMSVASIFEADALKKIKPILLQWQIDRVNSKLRQNKAQLEALYAKRDKLEPIKDSSKQNQIEYNYAISDIEKTQKNIDVLENQINKLNEDLTQLM